MYICVSCVVLGMTNKQKAINTLIEDSGCKESDIVHSTDYDINTGKNINRADVFIGEKVWTVGYEC